MNKVKQMLEALEKELRNEKQYSSADRLLPIIEEAKKEQFTDYHGVVEQLEEYINETNNIDYIRALVEAIEVIKKRTYLKDGWIPCSERFPAEKRLEDKFYPSDEVLIYVYYGDGCVITVALSRDIGVILVVLITHG